jgi:hypothetical protein
MTWPTFLSEDTPKYSTPEYEVLLADWTDAEHPGTARCYVIRHRADKVIMGRSQQLAAAIIAATSVQQLLDAVRQDPAGQSLQLSRFYPPVAGGGFGGGPESGPLPSWNGGKFN